MRSSRLTHVLISTQNKTIKIKNTYSSRINANSNRVSCTANKLIICFESLHSISTAISWLISLLRHWSRRRRRKNLAAYLTPVFLWTTRLTVPNLPLQRYKQTEFCYINALNICFSQILYSVSSQCHQLLGHGQYHGQYEKSLL